VEQPDPAGRFRIEEIGASDSPDRACVEVVVRDEQGLPVAGLWVQRGLPSSRSPADGLGGETDEQGRVVLEHRMTGRLTITASSNDVQLGGMVTCEAGRRYLASLVFPRGGVPVTGSVVHRDRGSLAFVPLTLFRVVGNVECQLAYRTTTDERGAFIFDRVAPGPYRLVADTGGIGIANSRGVQVDVPHEGAVMQDLYMGVRSLHGFVRQAGTGEVLSPYRVWLYPEGCSEAERELAVCRPEFEFFDLKAGRYDLRASWNGQASKTIQGIQVLDGEELGIDIEVEPEAILLLGVTDLHGEPVKGVLDIAIGPPGSRKQQWTRTAVGDAGGIRLKGLESGENEVEVRARGQGEAVVNVALQQGENRLNVQLRPAKDG